MTFKEEDMTLFVSERDRRLNPVFVGRETVQNEIRRSLYATFRSRPDSYGGDAGTGHTHVVQGAPGAGKTSLLQKIERDCLNGFRRNRPPTALTGVIPLYLPTPGPLQDQRFELAMRRAVENLGRSLPGTLTSKAWQGLSNFLELFRLNIPSGLFRISESTDIPDHHVVLLMIDEIQQAKIDPHSRLATMIKDLHGGVHDQPVIPILAGLSNSQSVVQQLGISRLGDDCTHNLGRLPPAQVQEAVHRFLDIFGIQATPAESREWTRIVMHRSQGWPKHLHNNLKALGQELLHVQGQMAEVDPEAVRRNVMRRRYEYYASRLGSWAGRPQAVSSIMSALGHDVHDEDVIYAMTQAIAARMPHDTRPRPQFEDLRRLGLISHVGSDPTAGYACPIPSLHSFAVAQSGTRLHKVTVLGDTDQMHRLFSAGTLAIDGRDDWQRTALHLAALDGEPVLLRPLLEHGADVNARDRWQRTPLHLAAASDADRVISMLHGRGADIQAVDHDGNMPLHLAARNDALHAAQVLVPLLLSVTEALALRNASRQTPVEAAPLNSATRSYLEGLGPDNAPPTPGGM